MKLKILLTDGNRTVLLVSLYVYFIWPMVNMYKILAAFVNQQRGKMKKCLKSALDLQEFLWEAIETKCTQ